MYDVDFITNLSFMQVFGAIFIFSLVAYNGANNKKEEKFDEMIKRILTNIFTGLFTYLALLGIAYLILKVAF